MEEFYRQIETTETFDSIHKEQFLDAIGKIDEDDPKCKVIILLRLGDRAHLQFNFVQNRRIEATEKVPSSDLRSWHWRQEVPLSDVPPEHHHLTSTSAEKEAQPASKCSASS